MSVKRALRGICAALLASAVLASGASAATLVGDYQFQGTLNSSGAGAPLSSIGPGTSGFQTASVFGSPRSVYAFPRQNGVRMAPAGIPDNTTPYSIVTTFKLDAVDGYRRILDISDDTEDRGIYVHNGHINDYLGPGAFDESTATVGAGQFFTFAATVDAGNTGTDYSGTLIYVDGTRVIASSIAIGVPSNAIRFFRDSANPALNNDEDSSGAVSCIRVFTGILTDAEVAGIGASPMCGRPPDPAAVVVAKKCKRKKHKRHHASAAKKHKKKCKKKRKK